MKVIVFDLDGTLLDTLSDIASSCNRILIQHHFPPHLLESYREYVGEGPKVLMERILPPNARMNRPLIEQMVQEQISDYQQNCTIDTKLYDGMYECLHTLHSIGYSFFVFTNKQQEIAEKVIQNYLKDIPFLQIIGYSNKYQRKPNPEALLAAFDYYHIDTSTSLYVGDSEVDVETSKRAKIPLIGVDYGFRSKKQLIDAGAKIILSHPLELLHYL